MAFDLLDELGTAPTTLAICREGYRKTGEALPPLLALLTLENGLRKEAADDSVPDEEMIGPVPGWALDAFSREGKLALRRLLATNAGIAEFARRVGGDLSDRLRSQLMFETLGVDPLAAIQALDLMREYLPLLNRIRRTVMGGRRNG